MTLSFAVPDMTGGKDRQKEVWNISQVLEGCAGQKVAAKRPTLQLKQTFFWCEHSWLLHCNTV